MIIAKGSLGDSPMLAFGLTKGNIERLMAGRPMRLHRSTHGEGIPENTTIVIMYADSQAELEDTMMQFATKDAVVRHFPGKS